MLSIPNFDASLDYTFNVEVSAPIGLTFATEPTIQELKEALFDNFVAYINWIYDHDFSYFAEHFVTGELIDRTPEF